VKAEGKNCSDGCQRHQTLGARLCQQENYGQTAIELLFNCNAPEMIEEGNAIVIQCEGAQRREKRKQKADIRGMIFEDKACFEKKTNREQHEKVNRHNSKRATLQKRDNVQSGGSLFLINEK
jgi:hypothetical protein